MLKIVKTALATVIFVALTACSMNPDPELQNTWDQLTDTEKREACLSYSPFNRNPSAFIDYVVAETGESIEEVTKLEGMLNIFCW